MARDSSEEAGRRCLQRLAAGAGPQFTLWGRTVVTADWTTHSRALPLHLLYFVTRHRMDGLVAGRQVQLRPGSLLWLGPRVRHHLWQPAGQARFGVYFLRFAMPAALGTPPFHLLVHDAWELRPAIQQLLDEVSSRRPLHEVVARGLLLQILGRALRRRGQAEAPRGLLSALQRERLGQLIERSAGRRIRPADMAAAVDLSPDYFTRLFRRSMGVSPKTWLMQQRIQAAASQLADTTGSIKQIAHGLGYRDLYLFSRQFKAVMKVSPREFRRVN